MKLRHNGKRTEVAPKEKLFNICAYQRASNLHLQTLELAQMAG